MSPADERNMPPPKAEPPPLFQFARFRFHLEVRSLMRLPPYKGAVFRGVFGAALRRLVCVAPKAACPACALRPRCLYVSLFEPPPPPHYPDAAKFAQAPRPYVLNPPLTTRQTFHPGDPLAFELVLLGPAIEALPYFIQLFQDQGRRGLGRERGRYALLQVEQLCNGAGTVAYDGKSRTLFICRPETAPGPVPATAPISRLTLEFLTPLRLKERGDLVTELTFPLLWERLAQRLTLLADFYGPPAEADHRWLPAALQARAAQVAVSQSRLRWQDWERYSRRQDTAMKLGGLVGSITFAGDLTPFLPYLHLGTIINLGQGTTFGLGRYTFSHNLGIDNMSG